MPNVRLFLIISGSNKIALKIKTASNWNKFK